MENSTKHAVYMDWRTHEVFYVRSVYSEPDTSLRLGICYEDNIAIVDRRYRYDDKNIKLIFTARWSCIEMETTKILQTEKNFGATSSKCHQTTRTNLINH